MNLIYAVIAFALSLLFLLAGITRVGAFLIEKRNPPVGAFATVRDTRMHYVHVPAPSSADLPPIVFIHGASGNLRDQMLPAMPLLEGRAEMLFLDRPGHGWSARGSGNNETPSGQAATIAALMDELGIGQAVIVGHSFGGAVVAAFALQHPEKTRGLVFASAATHPWPGGGTSWYYELTALPVIGRIFSETFALPGGTLRMAAASACVFAPNALPERYNERAGIKLVLRPRAFRSNAVDVAGLYPYVSEAAARYPQIDAPTAVISGTRDTVVYEEIHSQGLARDIPGATLTWVRNMGHKPDWISPDLIVAAIEKVSGRNVDLDAVARGVEARIADDAHGPIERCPDEKPPVAEAAQ